MSSNREIERKFLVKPSYFTDGVPNFKYRYAIRIKQGYLVQSSNENEHRLVRVRLEGGLAYIAFKSSVNQSIERVEIETQIDKAVALSLLEQCPNLINKMRYYVDAEDRNVWEVDVFEGENQGLFVGEIELKSVHDTFIVPEWCDVEVTHDSRYNNNNLSNFPFKKWSESVIKQAAQMFDLEDELDNLYISWNPYMTDGFICHVKSNAIICNVSDIWKKSFFG